MSTTPKGSNRGPVSSYRGEIRLAEKHCRKCGTTKPIGHFRIDKYITATGSRSLRVSTHCKDCQRARKRAYHAENKEQFVAKAKAWAEANPERHREQNRGIQHRKRLKLRGITQAEYDAMLSEQLGLCGICGQPPPVHHARKHAGVDSLSIDHCHETGRARGLLCRRCNLALGNIMENEQFAIGLLEYIRTKC